MKRHSVPALSLAIALAFALLRLFAPASLELLDLKTLDIRHQFRGPLPAGGEIAIVAIDEASLTEVGRWPWPRARLAALVDRLAAAGAAAVGFDIIFDQPDPSVDLGALQAAAAERPERPAGELLAALREQLDNDARLATALRASARTVLGHWFEFDPAAAAAVGNGDRARFSELTVRVTQGASLDVVRAAPALLPNIAPLAAAATAAGHLNFFPDPDGACRRIPLALRLGERVGSAFSVEMLRRYLGGAPAAIVLQPYGVAGLRVGDRDIVVDEAGDLWLNHLGPAGTFSHLSAAAVLAGRVPPAAVAGKIVLVAATATSFDRLANPFSRTLPGVEIQATAIDNMLHDRSLRRPRWLAPFEGVAILALGLGLGIILARLRGIAGAVGATVLALGYLWGTQRLFAAAGLVVSVVYPLGALAACFVGVTVLQYVTEEREKRKIRDAFRHYLNPEVTELLSRHPERLRLGGEKREISILFSDIRGFTTISEGLTPEALGELLNEYLGVMTDIVFRHEGLLDKYIGDAVMAFWGAPVATAGHAGRACRAALEMLAALPGLHERWRARGWPAFWIGVGIDTGECVVGNFGSAQRFSYTAMGDHVNLASRLEGLNKQYGTRALVSAATRAAIGEEFVCREVDRVKVKGKKVAVAIYELLARRADDADGRLARLATEFEAALAAYRGRAWDEAIARLERLGEAHPGDGPVGVYLERCRVLRATPPGPEWDGVFEAKTK